jgi:WD40 repeat protein
MVLFATCRASLGAPRADMADTLAAAHCQLHSVQRQVRFMGACTCGSATILFCRNCVQTLEGIGLGHDATVWSICFNAAGTLLASSSADLTVKIWSCESKVNQPFYKLQTTISGHHRRAVYSVAWSSSGRLATASGVNGLGDTADPKPMH